MGTTFTSNAPTTTSTSVEAPCLCAQMAESFSVAMDGNFAAEVRADLAREADPTCRICGGTGVEVVESNDSPTIHWNIGNASALFRALGLPCDEPYGDLSVADARRAIMRARARKDLTPFTRPETTTYGRPRANEDGSVELRPLRSWGGGLDVEGLQSRIERFAGFVEEAASRGATKIIWY